MKTTTDTLFYLLKEMKQEQFDSFCFFVKAFYTGKTQQQILLVCQYFYLQADFKETEIKKEIGKPYKEIKSKSYYCLLDYLRILNKDKSFIDVQRYLDFAILMQDKSHWNEAIKFFEKANDWAKLNNSKIYALLIIAHKSWSLYKTDKEQAPTNAFVIAKENNKLSKQYYTSSSIYLLYATVAEVIFRTYLLRNQDDIDSINNALKNLSYYNNIEEKLDRHNTLMAREWCLQLLNKHEEAFLLEKMVFTSYYENYINNKSTFKPLMASSFINFISVCATSKNESAYVVNLKLFKECFEDDFDTNILLKLVYNTFYIQQLKFFNNTSILLADIIYTEALYLKLPKGDIDVTITRSCECVLFFGFNYYKQFNKAQHYCQNVMKQKLTTGIRKDFIEVANLFYLIILFEETINKQQQQNKYNFENNLLYIHAQQYYERIRKSKDNYSFDILFLNFYRKLPVKTNSQSLHLFFTNLLQQTLVLKSKPENIYMQNMFLLLDFEEWIKQKVALFAGT